MIYFEGYGGPLHCTERSCKNPRIIYLPPIHYLPEYTFKNIELKFDGTQGDSLNTSLIKIDSAEIIVDSISSPD